MKQHSAELKQELVKMGKEIDSIITYQSNGETITLHDELYKASVYYNGNILKSVMKQLDLESSLEIPVNTIVNYQLGIKVGNSYEYLDYGNYVVYKTEKNEDTKTYNIICYDKMLYSMKDYESLGITYPVSIRTYIGALCTKIGLTFANSSDNFANYNRTLTNDPYLDNNGNSLGYTYRDVLDQLAEVTASIICINDEDKLEIRYINNTQDTINEEFLKDINVKFGEQYGPINTIVLSRSAGADNIYYPSILPENPIEIKITDNQIMNGNNRDTYMPDIYQKLNGLTYYINDFSSIGLLYYDIFDKYNIQIGQNTYSCLMLNDEINVTQGIEELVYTNIPEQSQTDYSKANDTDRKINQTYLIVDKQNQKIESLISEIGDRSEKTTTVTQDIDGLTSTVSELYILEKEVQGNSYVVLDNCANVSIDILEITGEIAIDTLRDDYPGSYGVVPMLDLAPMSSLAPSKSKKRTTALYFGDTTILKGMELIREYTEGEEIKKETIILPEFTLRTYQGVSDIFRIQEKKATIERRVYEDDVGYREILLQPIIEELGDFDIELYEGDNKLYLKCFPDAHLYAKYMIKNKFSENFATKVEMNSEINQKADEINSSVRRTYETKDNAITQYTTINQKIDNDIAEVNIEVAKKYNTSDFTGAKIMLAVNDDTSSATIDADKISLARKRNKINK